MASSPSTPVASPSAGRIRWVKRQWCGHRGKVDNCQVGVFMGYVSHHDHVLLDFRLSLPEEWARDEQRRQACHVPEDVLYRTRHDHCLEMLDEWSGQVPCTISVSGDYNDRSGSPRWEYHRCPVLRAPPWDLYSSECPVVNIL